MSQLAEGMLAQGILMVDCNLSALLSFIKLLETNREKTDFISASPGFSVAHC
jgi:hypothetical protein